MAAGSTRALGGSPPAWAQRVPETIVLGRYCIQARFASNRNTEVYFAHDIELPGRRVVVKKLAHPTPEMHRAFDAEKEILKKLNHPAIARLYEDGTEKNVRYLVQEYQDRQRLTGERLATELALDTVMSLLDVVDYLHRQTPPVIHADIKPGNVLADSFAQVTLIDFNAAHVGESPAAREIQATRGYAPAEQLSGGIPKKSWDIYACGALLHQLLTGIDPASWQGKMVPPVPAIPDELNRVLRCSLALKPKERFQSARDFRHALERARAYLTGHQDCPRCGQEQAGGVHFCHRCGTLLLVEKLPAGEPRRPITRAGLQAFNSLESGQFVTRGTLELRMEAEALARPLGFDTLMSVDHLAFEPHRHQLQVLKKALKNHLGRSMLADEVGLGKTIEAGLVREELVLRGLVQSTLVLVPASLREQWKEELEDKFGARFDIYDSSTKSKLNLDRLKNVIISLDTATRTGSKSLLGRRWDLVIVDEAHHARNRRTKRWAFLEQLDKSYLLLLTATPLQNKLEELFNLISILRPGLLGTNPKDFERRYGVNGRMAVREKELRADLEKAMIRTRRSQAYVRFPERRAYTRTLNPTEAENKLYEGVTALVHRLAEEHGSSGRWQLQLIHLQQRATSSPEALADSLHNLASKAGPRLGQRVLQLQKDAEALRGRSSKLNMLLAVLHQVKDRTVVFTDHVPTQRMLKEHLTRQGFSTSVFRGTAVEKKRSLDEFAERGQVLIVSSSGNEGLNLQKHCHIMVNYDLPWNPMRIEQRIGRIQRLGQARDVLVFNLTLSETVEEHVLNVLDQKIRLFEISVGQLDLILGEQVNEEHAFEERILKCLLQARSNVELEKLLKKEFKNEAQKAAQLEQICEASNIVGF